jgi:hypothetical protein
MLIEQYVPDGRFLAERMRRDLFRASEAAPVGILAEYFAGTRLSSDLFRLAKLFSKYASERSFHPATELVPEVKSILGVLTDFFGLNRGQIFRTSTPVVGADVSIADDGHQVQIPVDENDAQDLQALPNLELPLSSIEHQNKNASRGSVAGEEEERSVDEERSAATAHEAATAEPPMTRPTQ